MSVRSHSRHLTVNVSGGVHPIKTLFTLLLLAGVLMALLGVIRVPFAVRFWRKLQWVAWVYIAVVVLSAIRLWMFS